MELIDIMRMSSAVYSGMPINHTVFIGHKGIWRSYQSVICFFPFETGKQSYSVNTKNLSSVLSKMEDAECSFMEKFVLIKRKNVSVELPYVTLDKSDLSIFKALQKRVNAVKEWTTIPSNFAMCIDACSKTVSTNAIHGTLSCISITGKQIYTSNNISLSIATLDEEFPKCLLDKSALVGALAIKPIEYALVEKGKHIVFRNEEGATVQIPTVSGNYPDFGAIAEMECSSYVTFDGHSIGRIAGISETLFEGTDMFDNTLKVIVKDGKLRIQNMAEAGKVTAEIDVDFKENFTFAIDSKTLQLLAVTDTKIGIEDGKIIVKSESLKIVSSVGE